MEKTGMMKCRKDLWRLWLRLLHHVFWKETETGWLGMKDGEWKDGAKRMLGEGDTEPGKSHWERSVEGEGPREWRITEEVTGVRWSCHVWHGQPCLTRFCAMDAFRRLQRDSRVALLGCKLLKIFCISCNVCTLEDCIEKFWVLDTSAKSDLATLDLHSWVENLNGA